MPDIRGLVSDPDFQALSPDRQRALLERAGADPGFIEEKTGAGRGLGGATIEATPEFQKPIRISMKDVLGPTQGENVLELASPDEMAEYLPAAGSALGAVAGGPWGLGSVGSAVGGAAGEFGRQALRKLVGFAPATGVGQELLDLDPNSPEAMILGAAMEAGGGIGGDIIGRYAGKTVAPRMRREGVERFASIAEQGPRETKEIIKRLESIADDLPMGTRKGMTKKAVEMADEANRAVSEFYEGPAGEQIIEEKLARPRVKLADLEGEQVFTEEIKREVPQTEVGRSITTGERSLIDLPPKVETTPRYIGGETAESTAKSAQGRWQRMLDLEESRKAADIPEGPLTARDLRDLRKEADVDALRAQSEAFAPDKRTREILPKAKAARAERTGLQQALHSNVPGAAEVDARATAYNTLEAMLGNNEMSHFLARWGLSRALGGTMGTAVGAVAASPAMWKSVWSRIGIKTAALLKAGNEVQAQQLLRGAIDEYMQEQVKKRRGEKQ
jgi:hypothetical protein